MSYDIFHGKQNDPAALRQMAADAHRRSEESFQRCDTDGFLSQWASDITGRQYSMQAEIAEAGGRAPFSGLYDGDRRVAARLIEQPKFNAPWITIYVWRLRADEAATYGRRFVPSGRNSRVQRQLGLCERRELAPAMAAIGGRGKGLSGCASAYVCAERTGDEWGLDSVLAP